MLTVVVLSVVLTLLSVSFHVAALGGLAMVLSKLRDRPVLGTSVVLVGAIAAQLVEISLYAVGYGLLTLSGGFGAVGEGRLPGHLNFFYASAVTFTSLGFSENAPSGDLRLMAAFEALTGLVLITWTASLGSKLVQAIWEGPFESAGKFEARSDPQEDPPPVHPVKGQPER